MKHRYGPARVVWQGRSWRLKVAPFHPPDGPAVEKGYIDHPGAVAILPIQDGRALVARQYRLALDQTILELPAGTRDPAEDWLACARRELREETGYRAEQWTSLGQIWPAPGVSNEVMAVYLAQELVPDPLPADADEEIAVEWRPLSELIAMALDGRLQDAKSVIAVLRAARHLGMPLP
jgi:ADP-ribose pyrophosphatase